MLSCNPMDINIDISKIQAENPGKITAQIL